jgi:hypothetical protein
MSNVLKYNNLNHHLFRTMNIIHFMSMCGEIKRSELIQIQKRVTWWHDLKYLN